MTSLLVVKMFLFTLSWGQVCIVPLFESNTGSYSNFLSGKGGKAEGCLFSFFTHLSHKVSSAGREIAPNTGANVTKFFTLATKS